MITAMHEVGSQDGNRRVQTAFAGSYTKDPKQLSALWKARGSCSRSKDWKLTVESRCESASDSRRLCGKLQTNIHREAYRRVHLHSKERLPSSFPFRSVQAASLLVCTAHIRVCLPSQLVGLHANHPQTHPDFPNPRWSLLQSSCISQIRVKLG